MFFHKTNDHVQRRCSILASKNAALKTTITTKTPKNSLVGTNTPRRPRPMEIDSQSTPPPPPPDPSQSTPAPSQNAPDADADADPTPSLSKKRRRRKKQFPEMIPSSQSLRSLRPNSGRPSIIYNEKALDRLIRRQINRSISSRRRRSQLNDLNTESLIAHAVGFPIDSLTEEEIEASVIPVIEPLAQSNYITVRNHIVSLFRCSPSSFLTEDQAAASIRSEHRRLVTAAYSFLHTHAYINFGVLNNIPLSLPSISSQILHAA